jgi:endonuclease I
MKILEAWSLQDPVSEEECERYKAIKKIQKNENVILMKECKNNELK